MRFSSRWIAAPIRQRALGQRHHRRILPRFQDRWSHLNRDPLITVWTALDPATEANGCVQLIPGSHRNGLVNPEHGSGFVRPDQAKAILDESTVELLELEPGEAALLHNWTLHASDVNRTEISRRAFSVCYMDATTQGGSYRPLWEN